MALKKPRDVSIHGERRIDDYFWLREKDSPEVQAHLQAEGGLRGGLVQAHRGADGPAI